MTVKKKNKIIIHTGVFALFLLISFLMNWSLSGTYVRSDKKSYITAMESADA